MWTKVHCQNHHYQWREEDCHIRQAGHRPWWWNYLRWAPWIWVSACIPLLQLLRRLPLPYRAGQDSLPVSCTQVSRFPQLIDLTQVCHRSFLPSSCGLHAQDFHFLFVIIHLLSLHSVWHTRLYRYPSHFSFFLSSYRANVHVPFEDKFPRMLFPTFELNVELSVLLSAVWLSVWISTQLTTRISRASKKKFWIFLGHR